MTTTSTNAHPSEAIPRIFRIQVPQLHGELVETVGSERSTSQRFSQSELKEIAERIEGPREEDVPIPLICGENTLSCCDAGWPSFFGANFLRCASESAVGEI